MLVDLEDDRETGKRSLVRAHLNAETLFRILKGDWNATGGRIAPGFEFVLLEQSNTIRLSQHDFITVGAVAGTARRWRRTQWKTEPVLGALSINHHFVRGPASYEWSFGVSALEKKAPSVSLGTKRYISKHVVGGISFSGGQDDSSLSLSLTRSLGAGIEGNLEIGFGAADGVKLGIRKQTDVKSSLFTGNPSAAAAGGMNGRTASFSTNGQASSGHHHRPNDRQTTATTLGKRVMDFRCFVSPIMGFTLESFWVEPVTKRSRVKTSILFSMMNVQLELESSRTVSERSKLAGSLVLNLSSGVTFKLKYNRGSSRYEFPILLSKALTLSNALVGGLVPMVLERIVRMAMYPWRLHIRTQRRRELIQASLTARARAKNQRLLMKPAAESRKQEQAATDGLYVVTARFGLHLEDAYDWNDGRLTPNIDATSQMNFYLNKPNDVTLVLKAGSKVGLLGFYDPSIGTESFDAGFAPDEEGEENEEDEEFERRRRNRLYVRYWFRGFTYEITFEDEDEMRLPNPAAVLMRE